MRPTSPAARDNYRDPRWQVEQVTARLGRLPPSPAQRHTELVKILYEVSSWKSEVRAASLVVVLMLMIATVGIVWALAANSLSFLGLTAFGVLFAAGMLIRLLLIKRQLRNGRVDAPLRKGD